MPAKQAQAHSESGSNDSGPDQHNIIIIHVLLYCRRVLTPNVDEIGRDNEEDQYVLDPVHNYLTRKLK